jgi:hypothetical protein
MHYIPAHTDTLKKQRSLIYTKKLHINIINFCLKHFSNQLILMEINKKFNFVFQLAAVIKQKDPKVCSY